MAPAPSYSLSELAEKSGTSERMIRTYLSQGLIPRSGRLGRGARYPHSTLERLRVIDMIRTRSPAHTTLDQVRELLNQLDEDMISAIATGRVPIQLIDDGRDEATVATASPPQPLGSPRPGRPVSDKQVVSLEHQTMESDFTADPARLRVGRRNKPTMVFSPRAAGSAAPRQLDELVKRLRFAERALGTSGRYRESIETPAEWHRVSAGTDLEIHARGPLSADDLTLLKEAAELLALMLRGPSGSRLQQITIEPDADDPDA